MGSAITAEAVALPGTSRPRSFAFLIARERFGRNVRFTPKSGHPLNALGCPLCAISGHGQGGSSGVNGIQLCGLLPELVGAARLATIRFDAESDTFPMSSPVSTAVTRFAYGLSQLPRVAWYLGLGLALRQLSEAARRREGLQSRARRRPHTDAPVPGRDYIYAEMIRLFMQDLANVEAGIYPVPADHDGSLLTMIHRSRLFFEDLPKIHRRRERRAYNEVLSRENRGKRPSYYLQNFHFQSGGWMTDDSAERYDTQVEVLLNGAANAIRRQALPQLHEAFAGRDQRKLQLLDIGCGTGRFLDFVKQTWPRLQTIGLDMSEPYLRHAQRHLKRWTRTGFVVGKAEAMPLPDNSQDAVTNIFLFHELPPKVRRFTIGECARVLKPGGRLIILDSLQRGDRPDYDGLLELFPQNYHEPYYSSYTNEDFGTLAADCDLKPVRTVETFVSKVMVFDKPLAQR